MRGLVQDFHYTLRQLRKSPGFTTAAVLTLAMAVGANTVVFSVLNGLILKPLNVPDAQTLYLIQHGTDNYPLETRQRLAARRCSTRSQPP